MTCEIATAAAAKKVVVVAVVAGVCGGRRRGRDLFWGLGMWGRRRLRGAVRVMRSVVEGANEEAEANKIRSWRPGAKWCCAPVFVVLFSQRWGGRRECGGAAPTILQTGIALRSLGILVGYPQDDGLPLWIRLSDDIQS